MRKMLSQRFGMTEIAATKPAGERWEGEKEAQFLGAGSIQGTDSCVDLSPYSIVYRSRFNGYKTSIEPQIVDTSTILILRFYSVESTFLKF